MIGRVEVGNYLSAAVVAAVVGLVGVVINNWTARKQRAIDISVRTQEKGQDNSDYWEGQTLAMRKEITRMGERITELEAEVKEERRLRKADALLAEQSRIEMARTITNLQNEIDRQNQNNRNRSPKNNGDFTT